MNVKTARKIRIAAAPTVQPISSRVLPCICAATAPLRARNLISEQISSALDADEHDQRDDEISL